MSAGTAPMQVHGISAAALGPQDMAARPGHLPSLDGLRAVSIGIVLGFHFIAPAKLFGFSAFGVTIFFFLSGFLITRLFFAEIAATGTIDIAAFYVRRIFRLYPVILVYLAVGIVATCLHGRPVSWFEVSSALFYFTNYLVSWRELHGIPITMPIGSLWSLAVEEHFYIVMPFVVVALRHRPATLARVALLICLASLVMRVACLWANPDYIGTLATYRRTEMRSDAIAVGVMFAAWAQTVPGRRRLVRAAAPSATVLVLIVLAVSFAIRNEFFKDSLRFSIQSFALIPIFCNILFSPTLRWIKVALNLPAVSWIGRLSYSLYIWHDDVDLLLGGLLLAAPLGVQPWMRLSFAFLMAVISYYCLERRFLQLRKGLFQPKTLLMFPPQAI